MCEFTAEHVTIALDLVRDGELGRLGESALAQSALVRAKLNSHDTKHRRGEVLQELLRQSIQEMGRDAPHQQTKAFRRHSTLSEYYLKGKTFSEVCSGLGIVESTGYPFKNEGLEQLALKLQTLDDRAGAEMTNRWLPYVPSHRENFVTRHTPDGEDWVEEVVRGLTELRPWAVSIAGLPGVGKTTLGIVAVRTCIDRVLFDRFVWVRYPWQRGGARSATDLLLSDIGRQLGVRTALSTKSDEDQIHDLCVRLADMNRKGDRVLIAIDATEFMSEHDRVLLRELFDYTGPDVSVLLIGRSSQTPLFWERPYDISGMSIEEATLFVRQQCDGAGLEMPSDSELLTAIERSDRRPLMLQWAVRAAKRDRQSLLDVLEDPDDPHIMDRLLARLFGPLDELGKKVCLSVRLFPRGATRDAIQAMAQPEDPVAFTRCLASLLRDHLLVESERGVYDMVHLAREYVVDLEEGGTVGGEPVRDRLRDLCGRALRYYHGELAGRPIGEGVERMRRGELDRVLAVLSWGHVWNLDEEVCDLLEAVDNVLGVFHRGNALEYHGDRAVSAAQRLGDHERVAWLRVHCLAYGYRLQGKSREARKILEEVLVQAEDNDWDRVAALCLRQLGNYTCEMDGDAEGARTLLERALTLFKACGDSQYAAYCASSLGQACRLLGDLECAKELFEYSLSVRRTVIQEQGGVAMALADLALCHALAGDIDAAVSLSDNSLETARGIPAPSRPFIVASARRAQIDHLRGKDFHYRAYLHLKNALSTLEDLSKRMPVLAADSAELDKMWEELVERYRDQDAGGIPECLLSPERGWTSGQADRASAPMARAG